MIIIDYLVDSYQKQKLSVIYLEINVFFSKNLCVFVLINKVKNKYAYFQQFAAIRHWYAVRYLFFFHSTRFTHILMLYLKGCYKMFIYPSC
jgi:hypothetical protein